MRSRLVAMGLALLCVAASPSWGEKLPDGRLARRSHQPAIATSAGIFSEEPGVLELGDGRLRLLDVAPGGPVRLQPAIGTARTLDCGVSASSLAARSLGGHLHVLVVHTGGGCHLDGEAIADAHDPPALLVVDAAAGTVEAAIALRDPAATVVLHPSGKWAYVPTEVIEQRRGQLHVLDLRDLDKARLATTVALASGLTSPSLAIDPDGAHLYAAAGTHTLSLDLADPSEPVIEGRIFDYMVRTHTSVEVTEVVDEFWGRRRFLTVTARLGGGTGCLTGTVFVYDITGELRTRPIMVAESDIPEHDEHGWTRSASGDAGPCPVARATLEPEEFRLRLGWQLQDGTPLRRDWFAYDTTPLFQASADFCTLLPV